MLKSPPVATSTPHVSPAEVPSSRSSCRPRTKAVGADGGPDGGPGGWRWRWRWLASHRTAQGPSLLSARKPVDLVTAYRRVDTLTRATAQEVVDRHRHRHRHRHRWRTRNQLHEGRRLLDRAHLQPAPVSGSASGCNPGQVRGRLTRQRATAVPAVVLTVVNRNRSSPNLCSRLGHRSPSVMRSRPEPNVG
jgi:hypothetical protein